MQILKYVICGQRCRRLPPSHMRQRFKVCNLITDKRIFNATARETQLRWVMILQCRKNLPYVLSDCSHVLAGEPISLFSWVDSGDSAVRNCVSLGLRWTFHWVFSLHSILYLDVTSILPYLLRTKALVVMREDCHTPCSCIRVTAFVYHSMHIASRCTNHTRKEACPLFL